MPLYISPRSICEPLKTIKRPSFNSLTDMCVAAVEVGGYHGAADAILICTQRHTMPAQPQPRGAECARLPRFPSFTVVMRSCFYFHVDRLPTFAQPCSDLCNGCTFRYGFTGVARACATTLFADDRQLALRSPGCARRVIPGTASDWPSMMCMIPAWYTSCSKPRPTTSTQASFAQLHERPRALPPLRSVPNSLCRTWHDPPRRR
jgi:hypothetical protein